MPPFVRRAALRPARLARRSLCCASGQSFAPCALDNAQCRESAVSLTYAHPEWNARGARVETHPQTKQSINYAAESGLLMEACRARSERRELKRANLRTRRPSPLDAGACQRCVTFSTGRRSGPGCVTLWPRTLKWSGCVRRRRRGRQRGSRRLGGVFPSPPISWPRLRVGGVN